MATYRVLRAMSYEPGRRPAAKLIFAVGETFEYPAVRFPTVLDIVELVASKVIEEVTP